MKKTKILNTKKEVKSETISYITTAFGLVAGLAWNDAIKSLIELFFPLERNTVFLKFVYAIVITFIVFFTSMYLVSILNTEDKK